MKSSELNWSKTRAQCPYCQGWYTKQGILGHIRFRHPDRNKERTDDTDEIKNLKFKMYVEVAKIYHRNGRLPQHIRENVLDMMLLDFLSRRAKGKS